MVEWRGTLGSYAVAACRMGMVSWMTPSPKGPDANDVIWPHGVARDNEKNPRKHDIVATSLTDDNGEEAKRWELWSE